LEDRLEFTEFERELRRIHDGEDLAAEVFERVAGNLPGGFVAGFAAG